MCWRISCVAFFPGGLHAKDRPGGLSTGLGNLLRETPARPAATPYFATARGGSCPKWSSANLRIPGGECVYTARRSGGQIERCCAPNPLPRHSPAPTAQTLSGRRAAPGRDLLLPPPPLPPGAAPTRSRVGRDLLLPPPPLPPGAAPTRSRVRKG